ALERLAEWKDLAHGGRVFVAGLEADHEFLRRDGNEWNRREAQGALRAARRRREGTSKGVAVWMMERPSDARDGGTNPRDQRERPRPPRRVRPGLPRAALEPTR